MDTNELRTLLAKARLNNKTVEELDSEDYAPFLPFTDRDSYLEWVADWKETYKALSESIRGSKETAKNMARAGDPKAGFAQANAVIKGRQARALLALRRVAKGQSWAMRNAAKYVVSIASAV